jgi:peptidoglycan hydrolase CwlO-like protein
MTFKEICLEVLAIAEDLEYGNISFTYGKLSSAMKAGHPAEFVMESLDDLFVEIQNDIAPSKEKVDKLIKNLKRIKSSFKIQQLSKPIKDLTQYLAEQESN